MTVCGSCRRVIDTRDAETCWYCVNDLCLGCWNARGHCGHPGADAENERARKVFEQTCERLAA